MKIAKQLNMLENLPADAPESAVEERLNSLNDLISGTKDPATRQATKRLVEDAIQRRLNDSEHKGPETTEKMKKALEFIKIGNEALEFGSKVEETVLSSAKNLTTTVSADGGLL